MGAEKNVFRGAESPPRTNFSGKCRTFETNTKNEETAMFDASSPMATLPLDVWKNVFDALDSPKDKRNLSTTCKEFRIFFDMEELKRQMWINWLKKLNTLKSAVISIYERRSRSEDDLGISLLFATPHNVSSYIGSRGEDFRDKFGDPDDVYSRPWHPRNARVKLNIFDCFQEEDAEARKLEARRRRCMAPGILTITYFGWFPVAAECSSPDRYELAVYQSKWIRHSKPARLGEISFYIPERGLPIIHPKDKNFSLCRTRMRWGQRDYGMEDHLICPKNPLAMAGRLIKTSITVEELEGMLDIARAMNDIGEAWEKLGLDV